MNLSDSEALALGLLLCSIVVAILFVRDGLRKLFRSEKFRKFLKNDGRAILNIMLAYICMVCFFLSPEHILAFLVFAILFLYFTFTVGADYSHERLGQAAILNEIATALKNGIPLSNFVSALAGDYGDETSVRLKRLAELLAQGRLLSDSLEDVQLVPKHAVLAVRAGESCGGHAIPKVLGRAAEELKSQSTLRASYTFWLYYSACMIVVCTAIILFECIFILPKFQEIFRAMKLPSVGLTFPMAINWVANNALGPLGLLFVASVLLARNPRAKRFVGRVIAAVPVFGKHLRHRALARSARVMEALAEAGLSLPGMCRSVAAPEISGPYADSFAMLAARTDSGDSLNAVLPSTQLPDSFSWFAKAGTSGDFITAMRAAAEYHDARAQHYERILATLLPCVVMLAGGSVVGFFYIVVLLNQLKLTEAVMPK